MGKPALNHIQDKSAMQNSNRRRQAYYNYQLASCRKYLNKVCLACAAFNQLLLVPNLLFVSNPTSRMAVILLRSAFTILLISLSLHFSRNKGFRSFYRIISGVEFLSILLFLFVAAQYDQSALLIQIPGLYVILLIIFLLPNKHRNMILLSVFAMTAFLLLAWKKRNGLNINEMLSSIIYFAASIIICSIFARGRDRQQYCEFVTKKHLMKMSYTDQLTKVSNRNKLFKEFAKWEKICLRERKPLCLSLFDIDQFKSINDKFGHTIADRVLVELTGVIRLYLRPTDLIARWGGDEFVILLPKTNLQNAVRILNHIRTAVAQKQFAEKIHITLSFGVAQMKEGSTLDSIIQQVDDLMYEGKKQGGNKVTYRKTDAE
ncbi:MAG: GGDEF domain-containing protein [Oscillospiraceae bacterium]|jgi:diguanylate cyclase (GGDEF)-like protein